MIAEILIVSVMAYLIGSVPSGFIVVKLLTGQDLTQFGSGRTGGTNAMRAGGLLAGLLTGALDILKGAGAIWIARAVIVNSPIPGSLTPWLEVIAGIVVVIGHNWSVFLHWRGGAGTGPNIGVAIALLPGSIFVLPLLVVLVLIVTGYASVASMVTAIFIPILFALAARFMGLPVEWAMYGLGTCVIIGWALRPNLARLLAGTERQVHFKRRNLGSLVFKQ